MGLIQLLQCFVLQSCTDILSTLHGGSWHQGAIVSMFESYQETGAPGISDTHKKKKQSENYCILL